MQTVILHDEALRLICYNHIWTTTAVSFVLTRSSLHPRPPCVLLLLAPCCLRIQIQGSFVQGLGYFLKEEGGYGADGALLNHDTWSKSAAPATRCRRKLANSPTPFLSVIVFTCSVQAPWRA